ncbi:hypothetical protein CK203_053977 [Vitis vinifera]|uniref:Mitochondrial protein n=1 Tax=Vitis vinifera TaxID=29760 RepID=A0A438H899_VITVI|nr:hypothetical protein CK203_053977 [Vitis vinifera]
MATFSPPGAGKGKCTTTRYPQAEHVSFDNLSPSFRSFAFSLSTIFVPKKPIRKVLANPGWRVVMEEQMKALCDRGTWELQALPNGKEVVGCRWVVTKNTNPMGLLSG